MPPRHCPNRREGFADEIDGARSWEAGPRQLGGARQGPGGAATSNARCTGCPRLGGPRTGAKHRSQGEEDGVGEEADQEERGRWKQQECRRLAKYSRKAMKNAPNYV
eukprot:1965502-Pyramimonas_sp.AAC.1